MLGAAVSAGVADLVVIVVAGAFPRFDVGQATLEIVHVAIGGSSRLLLAVAIGQIGAEQPHQRIRPVRFIVVVSMQRQRRIGAEM